MSLLKIISVPDPVLKEIAQPVENIDDALHTQITNMIETMYDAPGIGLAANQIGKLNRVFVMDAAYREDPDAPEDTPRPEKNPITMINPEIIWESEDISIMEEGCLSIPMQYAEVQRPLSVRVKFLDCDGKESEMEVEGLASHCVQHELDHLNGVLFIDYLSKLKRDMMIKRVVKLNKSRGIL